MNLERRQCSANFLLVYSERSLSMLDVKQDIMAESNKMMNIHKYNINSLINELKNLFLN
jgi:hypothetical protein